MKNCAIFLVVIACVIIGIFLYRYLRKNFDALSKEEQNEIRKNVLDDNIDGNP